MCKQRAFTLLWVSFTCLFYGLAPYSFANKDPETNNLPPKNFISYPKTIKVVRGNENYPPYEFIEKGKLTGFHIDVITMVAKQMKLNIRFESLPWKRALKEIETGTADAISYITPTPTRKAFAIFLDDNVLSHSISGFLALKKNIKHIHYNGDLESLKPYRIGVQLGYAYGNKFDDTERLKKVKALSVAQMMGMHRAERIDLATLSMSEFNDLKKAGSFNDVDYVKPYLNHFKNYIAFSKSQVRMKLAKNFSKAMKDFKATNEYQALLDKYDIKQQPN